MPGHTDWDCHSRRRTPRTGTYCPSKQNSFDTVWTQRFFIINKPAGLIVHKPHRLSAEVSVVDWLLEYNLIPQSIGMPNRPGIVHRLDRDTSGILLIARTMHGLAALGSLFANRMVHKTYLAVVQGHTPESGVINSFIGRDPVTKVKMKAHHVQFDHTFRTAVTEFKTVKHCDTYSIINAFPKTGRTHQIRVHCASIGHPILADTTYGQKANWSSAKHCMLLPSYLYSMAKWLRWQLQFRKISGCFCKNWQIWQNSYYQYDFSKK